MEEEVGGVKMKMNKLRDELRKAKKETEKYKESQTTNVSSKSSDEPSTAEVCLIFLFSMGVDSSTVGVNLGMCQTY